MQAPVQFASLIAPYAADEVPIEAAVPFAALVRRRIHRLVGWALGAGPRALPSACA